jgi:hypothetical protein
VLINFIGIICRIFIRRLITTIIFINLLLLGKFTIKLIRLLKMDFVPVRGNSYKFGLT